MTVYIGANREYRDRLFKLIFGNPENKLWALMLYNAVNGAHYTDPDAVELYTIENVVYMSMKNDVSFLIGDTLNFYEQQSTFNPNMPMRFLVYAGMIYSKYIETNQDYLQYSSSQQKAPTPKCVCFYNGTAEKEDRITLSLSDSFAGESDIEVKVLMLNVNFGHNQALLDACKPLKEYSWFVNQIRTNLQTLDNLEKAIDAAFEEMPEDFLIRPFLLSNRAEVKRMCITEYDEAKHMAQIARHMEQMEKHMAQMEKLAEDNLRIGEERGEKRGEERGEKRGEERGEIRAFARLVKAGLLSVSDAAKFANMTVPEFETKMALIAE